MVLVGRIVIIILNLRFSKSCQISQFSSLPPHHITLRSSYTHSCIHDSSLYSSSRSTHPPHTLLILLMHYSSSSYITHSPHASLILLIHHSFTSYITHPPHTLLILLMHHSYSSYITHSPHAALILLIHYSFSSCITRHTNSLVWAEL